MVKTIIVLIMNGQALHCFKKRPVYHLEILFEKEVNYTRNEKVPPKFMQLRKRKLHLLNGRYTLFNLGYLTF